MEKALVVEFIELHAQAALAEKRLKELRAVLLPSLQAGEQSPADLPFVLELGNQARTQADWKSPLYRLLKRTLGKVRADKRMGQIEAAFGSIDIPTLSVKQNKKFASALGGEAAA